MKPDIKKINHIEAFLVELKAVMANKYKIDFFNPFFDKKTHWEIYKPKIYFDMYPESKVDNTAWVMEIFYFKIRRSV
jgi:hypothetical protein